MAHNNHLTPLLHLLQRKHLMTIWRIKTFLILGTNRIPDRYWHSNVCHYFRQMRDGYFLCISLFHSSNTAFYNVNNIAAILYFGSTQKITILCWDHVRIISGKFQLNRTSRTWQEVQNVKSVLTADDDGRSKMTIGHQTLRVRWPKKWILHIQFRINSLLQNSS